MKIYHYTTSELIAGIKNTNCETQVKERQRDALLEALSGNEQLAIKTVLHLNAYITASEAFMERRANFDVVEDAVFLSACDSLGKLIEEDATLDFTEKDERWDMAELLSSLFNKLHNEEEESRKNDGKTRTSS